MIASGECLWSKNKWSQELFFFSMCIDHFDEIILMFKHFQDLTVPQIMNIIYQCTDKWLKLMSHFDNQNASVS